MANWPQEDLDAFAVWFDQEVDENEFTIPDFDQRDALDEKQSFGVAP